MLRAFSLRPADYAYRGFNASNGQYHAAAISAVNAAHLQWMTRSAHKAVVDITSIQVMFTNVYAGATVPAADQVLKAAIEYTPPGAGAAINVPCTFVGQSSITLPASVATIVVCDQLDVRIPAGSTFFVRNLRTQASGDGGISNTGPSTSVGQCCTHGASVSDVVSGTGSFASTDIFFCAPPLAIIGPTTLPSLLLIGDSRVSGQGDQTEGTAMPAAGELARGAWLANLGYCNFGVVGSTAQDAATTRSLMTGLYGFVTHVIQQHGINDINASRSATQLAADQATIAAFFPGRKIYTCTISPYTNGANNAIAMSAAKETQRQQYNVNLRTGALPSGTTDIIDIARYTEAGGAYTTTGQTGLWSSSSYTSDGLHENQTGYSALAPSIQSLLARLTR